MAGMPGAPKGSGEQAIGPDVPNTARLRKAYGVFAGQIGPGRQA